jgi:hypothetical protein
MFHNFQQFSFVSFFNCFILQKFLCFSPPQLSHDRIKLELSCLLNHPHPMFVVPSTQAPQHPSLSTSNSPPHPSSKPEFSPAAILQTTQLSNLLIQPCPTFPSITNYLFPFLSTHLLCSLSPSTQTLQRKRKFRLAFRRSAAANSANLILSSLRISSEGFSSISFSRNSNYQFRAC